MRTITEDLFHRLIAQAQEAELQGFDKVAEGLTSQLEKYGSSIRSKDAFYSYNGSDFTRDVNSCLWNAIIRIADFYGITRFDALEIQDLIEKSAENLRQELCTKAGISHGIGAHEDSVLGEKLEKTDIEVVEGDN